MSRQFVKNLVDELGSLHAQKAILKLEEDKVKAKLTDAGVSIAEGVLFRLNIVEAHANIVNWKAVANKLKPSRQLVKANTKERVTISFKVTSRIGEKVAA